MANNQITPFQLTDQFTMDNFNQRINETNTALQKKVDGLESTDYPSCYYRMVDGVVEWFNPPMLLGVEYRTTERFLAKPVYQVAFEISELPAAGSVVSKALPVTYSTTSDIKIIGLEGGLLKQGRSFIGLSATDPAHYTDPYTKGWWAYPRENRVYVYSLINLAEVLANGTPKYDKFIIVAKYVRDSF